MSIQAAALFICQDSDSSHCSNCKHVWHTSVCVGVEWWLMNFIFLLYLPTFGLPHVMNYLSVSGEMQFNAM